VERLWNPDAQRRIALPVSTDDPRIRVKPPDEHTEFAVAYAYRARLTRDT
jgi:hypothetical protein